MMTNKRRGEVSLTLDGRSYTLCLTLGALAELEDTMELDNIGELADRFASGKVKSADLVKILGAALRGGGADMSDKSAASMRCEGGAARLTAALVALLQQTFDPSGTASSDEGKDGSEAMSANPLQAGLTSPARPKP